MFLFQKCYGNHTNGKVLHQLDALVECNVDCSVDTSMCVRLTGKCDWQSVVWYYGDVHK